MTPEQFAYWLQGYFEISESPYLDKEQVEIVREHLSLVFDKQTTKPNLDEYFKPHAIY